jgi:hypothetical protein
MNDYGMIQYGSKYHLYGAQKSLFTIWFCCQGSLPQTVTDYHNLIYFKDKENLYINLYIPSQVDWKGPDGLVTLIQETDFPEKEIVNIKVEVQKPSQFGLKFRVPSWAHTGVKIMVNHEPYETSTKPGEWAVIKRKWSFNDKVTLKFDLSPRIEPLPGYVSPVAVLCGPVVMVRSTARENEDRIPVEGDLKFPSDWLMGEDPLIAYTSSESMKANVDPKRNLHTNQMMRPYYDLKSGEYYRMYFERAGSKFVMPDQLTFQGNWQTEGNCRSTNEIGSSFEGTFEGSTLVWEGLRKNDAGIAQVSIDGNIVAEADQYGYTDVHVGRLDQREVPFRWSISNLGSGKHSLTVKVLSNKNQASKGNKINLSRLIVYP